MKYMPFTEEEKADIRGKELKHGAAFGFMQCDDCLKEYRSAGLDKVLTPRDYSIIEIGLYPFKYPDGTKQNIVAAWCKRCKALVWDARLLKPLE